MSNSPWPVGLSVSEGVANARAGRWVSLILIVTVAWVSTAVGLANALDVSGLVRAEREWIAAGAFVVSVEPSSSDSSDGIDVASCERLSQVNGISASFAARTTAATIVPTNAPGTLTTVIEVSPGAYAYLGAREPGGVGVLATVVAAEPTGLANGERTTFTRVEPSGESTSFAATAVVVDRKDLSPGLEGSFLLPTLLSGHANSCFVSSDAGHISAVSRYASDALSTPGSSVVVRPLLSKNTYGTNFATVYSTRLLGWVWVAAALALAAMWGLVQRTRRTRAAIYQSFGAHPTARLAMNAAEWATLSIPGAVWGWGLALSLAIGLGADPAISLAQTTLQIVATWCGASLGVIAIALIPVGSLLDALKDGP